MTDTAMQITNEFKDWFEREWSSYQDKAICGGKVVSMAWALKGYRAPLASRAAATVPEQAIETFWSTYNEATQFKSMPEATLEALAAVFPTYVSMLHQLADAARLHLDGKCSSLSPSIDAARAMLAASTTAPAQPCGDAEQADEAVTDAFARLVAFHAEQLDSNPYCYFELAYTRSTAWMAWITDRPAQGEPGTAAHAKSRKVIVRGQGDTPTEACQDALNALNAARKDSK